MNCLTEKEISNWLHDHSVTSHPYNQLESPELYLQVNCHESALVIASFMRQFLQNRISDFLFHITDWSTYRQSEMMVVDGLRGNSGESRKLVDAPGHLFGCDERELAVAMFTHTVAFEWSSHLYFPNDSATLYNWEGVRFDFWSDDSASFEQLGNLVDDFGLTRTAQI